MEMQGTRVPILLAIGTIAVALSTVVFGLLSASQTMQNTGNVRAIGVGVYTDSGCTKKAQQIDWGALTPGAAKNYTLYVRNEGTINVVLSMTTNNWTSAQASTYIALTWNKQSQTLNRQTTTSAILTLKVAANVTGISNFGFNIVITGTEIT
jgi:hypothetical protein